MYVVKGRLPAEVGALLMRALDAASDALFRENPTGMEGSDAERRRRAAQRRADAVALLAERALAAGFEDDTTVPVSGSRAERYQVVLHVDADTLSDDGEPGRSHLEDGTRVSAETSRRLSCDAARVTMTHAPGRLDPGCRPQNPHDITRATPCARLPGPWLPLSGLWAALHGRASRKALGRGRRDLALELSAALSASSPAAARGWMDGDVVGRGTPGVLRSARMVALRRGMGAARATGAAGARHDRCERRLGCDGADRDYSLRTLEARGRHPG
jgi:hypothetical protein